MHCMEMYIKFFAVNFADITVCKLRTVFFITSGTLIEDLIKRDKFLVKCNKSSEICGSPCVLNLYTGF